MRECRLLTFQVHGWALKCDSSGAPSLTAEGCPEKVCAPPPATESGLTLRPWSEPAGLTAAQGTLVVKALEKMAVRVCLFPRLCFLLHQDFCFCPNILLGRSLVLETYTASAESLPAISVPWQANLSWIYFSHIWEAELSQLQTEHPNDKVWEQVFCCAEAGDKLTGQQGDLWSSCLQD